MIYQYFYNHIPFNPGYLAATSFAPKDICSWYTWVSTLLYDNILIHINYSSRFGLVYLQGCCLCGG